MAKPPFDPEQYHHDLEIEAGDLQTAFLKQAGLYAFYAARFSEAAKQHENKKLVLDLVEAKLDKAIRDKWAEDHAGDEKAKALTADQINRRIRLSPEYVKAQREVIEAKGFEMLARDACKAFEQRKDMLVQLGARERSEMERDPVIRTSTSQRVKDAVALRLREREEGN